MFGDEEEIIRKPALRRYGVPALLVAFIGGGAVGIMTLMKHTGPTARPHIEQHIKQVVAKPTPKVPSPPQALTAHAGAGNDAFGLKAGEGGGDGSCVGDCGSGDADDGTYFENVLNGMVKDTLRDDDRLRTAHYRATVAIVFDSSGHVEHVQFQNFEGDQDARDEVARVLSRMASSESIPANAANGKAWIVRLNAHAPG